jgi:hypothetical protein
MDSVNLCIRIRIEPKCWIRIRIEVNPDPQPFKQHIREGGKFRLCLSLYTVTAHQLQYIPSPLVDSVLLA